MPHGQNITACPTEDLSDVVAHVTCSEDCVPHINFRDVRFGLEYLIFYFLHDLGAYAPFSLMSSVSGPGP